MKKLSFYFFGGQTSVFFLALLIPGLLNVEAQIDLNKGGAKADSYIIHLPYTDVRSKIVIEAEIQGEQKKLLFDTGAPTILYAQEGDISGLSIRDKIGVVDSQGNKESLYVGTAPEIILDRISFKDIPVLVMSPGILARCLDIDGIIGSNLLRNSVVQFDSRKKQIRISDNIDNLIVKEEFRNSMELDNQSRPFITIKLQGNCTVTYKVLFDSGFDRLFDFPYKDYPLIMETGIATDTIRGIGTTAMGAFGPGRDSEHIKTKFGEFQFGGMTISNFWAQTGLDETAKVGAELLDYGNVTIDYNNRSFYFEPFEELVVAQEENWEFVPAVRDGKMVVSFIWDQCGDEVELGDEIIAYDGIPLNKVEDCNWMSQSQPDGLHILVVLRKKDGRHYEYRLRRLNLP